mmetsp:Transcript_130044/g.183445  ORF Transcript_130044/g.183445 Transcript_130044/m.183445 type:complete len:124 (+) Transcript_130044:606-977(+)
MVAFICGMTANSSANGPYVVLTAALLTVSIVIGLTVYAFTTKTDFTMMGGLLWMMTLLFIFMGFCFWWMPMTGAMNIIYCTFGVLLFGLYLIYDTQLIAGGKRFKLSIDDYILGAMLLYIDII